MQLREWNGMFYVGGWEDLTLSHKPTTPHISSIRSDGGLRLETSAFQIFHGGNSTIINSFDETQFLFHSPTDATSRFL